MDLGFQLFAQSSKNMLDSTGFSIRQTVFAFTSSYLIIIIQEAFEEKRATFVMNVLNLLLIICLSWSDINNEAEVFSGD